MNGDGLHPIRPAEGVCLLEIATDDDHAIGEAITRRLHKALAEVEADQSIRAVVLVGGSRYFSSCASGELLLSGDPSAAVYSWCAEIPRLLLAFPVPTIAAMEGHAIGGGLVIGLWCDAAVLAEESMYGANFMALGFTPGMGSTVVVAEVLGPLLAREMLYTGRMLKGRELRDLPCALSHSILPRAEVRERAIALAAEMALVPRTSLSLLKATLSEERLSRLEGALERERRMHERSFADEGAHALLVERFGGEA